MANGTVLVASPSTTASTPVAMGSSVPACPALRASNTRFTTPTTSVDVMPAGLSTTTQPWTGLPLFLAIAALFLIGHIQITLDPCRFEDGLDLLRFGEGGVLFEPQVWRKFERDHPAHYSTDVPAMPVEGVDHVARILPTERFAIDGRMPHVRRRLHLCNGYRNTLKVRIAHIAAREYFRQSMPQRFADPQLAVRGDVVSIGAMTGHGMLVSLQDSRIERPMAPVPAIPARARCDIFATDRCLA